MNEKYIINPKLSWRFIEDEVLILDSNGKQSAHDLNSTGSFIFEKISQGLSTEAILNLLKNEYSNQDKKIESDFKHFLQSLLENEIILPSSN